MLIISKTFFISDLHFGHGNIIKYDNRPFKNVYEMDNILITNWNNTVSNEDIVYILGDISWYCLSETVKILKQLNGKKILIKGNHDNFCDNYLFKEQFLEICDYKEIKMNGIQLVLSHFPIMMWNWQCYHSVHLYGHVHNSQDYDLICDFAEKVKNNHPCMMFNVGCMMDYMGYTPRTLNEILDTER